MKLKNLIRIYTSGYFGDSYYYTILQGCDPWKVYYLHHTINSDLTEARTLKNQTLIDFEKYHLPISDADK